MFAELYLNGDLPKWYYYVTSAVTMVALIKPAKTPLPEGAAPDVRPVAMGEVWRRAVVSCAVGKENVAIGASYEGIQVAVGVKDASPLLLVSLTTPALPLSVPPALCSSLSRSFHRLSASQRSQSSSQKYEKL